MQRRSPPRAPKKAHLAIAWLGAWSFTLMSTACFSAKGPMAVAANEDAPKAEDEGPGAPARDEPGAKEGIKDKAKVEHSKKAVNLAVSANDHGPSNPTEPTTRPSSVNAEDRPEVVKSAGSRIAADYRSRLSILQEQNIELKRRSQELSAASKDLMGKLDEISALEDRLQRELGIGKARQEYRGQRIKSLAALIMTMPPQSGARILSNMSERDAQEIVVSMAQKSERKAAKLLAQMPANKAAELGKRYISADDHIKGSDGLIHNPTTPPQQKEEAQ